MDPTDSDERPPEAQRLGAGTRWLLKQRLLLRWPFDDLRVIDWLFLAVGIAVIFVVMAIAFALIYLLAALGVRGNLYGILVVGAGVSAVLAIPAMVIVRRRLPPEAEALLEAEDDGADELAEDATPAIFGVGDPNAGSGNFAGVDAALAPPDESRLSGPR